MKALRAVAAASAFLVSCGAPSPEGGFLNQAATCPGPSTVEGIDVSVYQGNINWAMVKADGRDFAIARISDGSFLDKDFAANWDGIKAASMVRGAYQFFEPGEDPAAQAKIVVDAVGLLGDGDLPVTADMEVTGGQPAATIVANLKTWMAAVQAGTGKTPMIYTGPGFWNGSVNSNAFNANPLWVANWGVNCPTLPAAWTAFQFWQYADNGTVQGIGGAVDLDKFNGTLADLQSFAGAKPQYAAKYVSQSWPLATMSFPMAPGEIIHANIVLRNVGTATWDANTKLATTQPRDRPSPFAGNWPAPNRLSSVTAPVAPGGTFEFDFDFQAPAQPGAYDEFYGLVEENVVWFSDPGQGGPPDDDIEAKIIVLAPDGGADAATAPSDGAAASDAATGADLALRRDAAPAVDASAGPGNGSGGGCGCAIGARPSPARWWMLLGLVALLGARLRRR